MNLTYFFLTMFNEKLQLIQKNVKKKGSTFLSTFLRSHEKFKNILNPMDFLLLK